jgi:type II secretion system protein G
MKIQNYKKGFTLIELLIVIVIIGILSSFLLANFIGVRQRARDGTRKSDLRQIQTALELYRSDNGSYPLTADIVCNSALQKASITYMQKVPCDPSTGASYFYDSPDTPHITYCIRACLENSKDVDRDNQASKYSTNDPVSGACAGTTKCSTTTNTTSYTLLNP